MKIENEETIKADCLKELENLHRLIQAFTRKLEFTTNDWKTEIIEDGGSHLIRSGSGLVEAYIETLESSISKRAMFRPVIVTVYPDDADWKELSSHGDASRFFIAEHARMLAGCISLDSLDLDEPEPAELPPVIAYEKLSGEIVPDFSPDFGPVYSAKYNPDFTEPSAI